MVGQDDEPFVLRFGRGCCCCCEGHFEDAGFYCLGYSAGGGEWEGGGMEEGGWRRREERWRREGSIGVRWRLGVGRGWKVVWGRYLLVRVTDVDVEHFYSVNFKAIEISNHFLLCCTPGYRSIVVHTSSKLVVPRQFEGIKKFISSFAPPRLLLFACPRSQRNSPRPHVCRPIPP